MPGESTGRAAVAGARDLARQRLLVLQHSAGYWKGEFDTGVIGDASDIVLRSFLGTAGDAEAERAAATILRAQGPDGGWPAYHDGPGNLMLSVLCYAALRLAGHPPNDPRLRRAAGFIRSAGGIERADNPAVLAWLCMLGLWPWQDIPLLPPELVLLPRWFPGNLYQIGAAARGIAVANSLFMTRCPVRPTGFDLRELFANPDCATGVARLPRPRGYRAIAAATHWYNRHRVGFLRARAITAAAEWLVQRQERDGGWGGNWLQTADSVVGLEAAGYPRDHPVIAAAMQALDQYVIDEPGGRRVEMWTAVVMDTALSVSALAMAGGTEALRAADRGAAWLLEHQVLALGDWAAMTRRPVAGAWPYEFVNDANPDADDTSWAVCALHRRDRQSWPEISRACERAVRWLLSQQGRDGGWAAFEPFRWRLPGARLLAGKGFLEPHSADITGHVLEALAARGLADHPQARRGVRWLLSHQRPDGSWPGWWACYHIHGTSASVTGLISCGLPAAHPAIARACAWLERCQQPDGGWGESIAALADPRHVGQGPSTASQTSWALLALVAAGRSGTAAAARGIEFLIRTQRPDGDWDEPWHTWIVVRQDLYWRDTLLRLVYPLTALSAYLNATGEQRDSASAAESGRQRSIR